MKRTIILLVIFIFAAAASDENDKTARSDKIKKVLRKIITDEDNPFFTYDNTTAPPIAETFCSGFTNNIEAEFDKSIECTENITLEDRTVCTVLHTDFLDCFENVIVFSEGCLDAPGNQLPRLLLQIAKSLIQQFCRSTGEQQLELLNPCLYEETDFLKRLTEDVTENKQKYDIGNYKLPSKEEMCKEGLEVKDLLTSHIRAACTGKVTRESAIGFVNATFEPCQASFGDSSANSL